MSWLKTCKLPLFGSSQDEPQVFSTICLLLFWAKSVLTAEPHGISKYRKVYLCYPPFFFFHNLWATSETASGILTNRPLAILLGCITVKQLTWDGTGHSTQANFLIAEYLSSRLVGITTHTSCVCRQACNAHLKTQFFIPAFFSYFPPTPFQYIQISNFTFETPFLQDMPW